MPAARTARAAASLEARRDLPGGTGLVLEWAADEPGPFHLLRRDVPAGTIVASVLPLDPILDRDLTGVRSPLMLPGAANPAAGPEGITLYQVITDAGGCSNLAFVRRLPGLPHGIVPVPIPRRGTARTARQVLAAFPLASEVRWRDASCRHHWLRRLPAGGFDGHDAFLPPGAAVELIRDPGPDPPPTVLVGAADEQPATIVPPAVALCENSMFTTTLVPLESEVFSLLCGRNGIDWVDADGDRLPDTCPAGMSVGRREYSVAWATAAGWGGDGHSVTNFGPRPSFRAGRVWDVPSIGVVGAWYEGSDPNPGASVDLGEGGALRSCRCIDSDSDGWDDCREALLGTDPADAASSGPDSDRDGARDDVDVCPGVPDTAQGDDDGDGLGDACDPCASDAANACADADGDGLFRGEDNCETVPNASQANVDRDAWGDACDDCPTVPQTIQYDPDGDGFGDGCDACPLVANPGQEDADGDGRGDPCDDCPWGYGGQGDSDGDGLVNGCDNCPYLANAAQADADFDGVGDGCDFCDRPFMPPDTDGDGLGAGCDCAWADPTARERPVELPGLLVRRDVLPGAVLLDWSLALARYGSASSFDVMGGSLAELRADRDMRRATCLLSGATGPAGSIAWSASAEWYLARGRNACAVGHWGATDILAGRARPCP